MANQSEKRQAGTGDEDEVTPAMIDAGVERFFCAYPAVGAGDDLDRRMVSDIYRVMRRLAGHKMPADED